MDKMTLTGPQQNVYDFVAKHGAVEVAQLKSRGLDLRAANNLVKSGVLTLTNNVYRIKAKRKAAKEEEAPKSAVVEAAPAVEAPEVAPAAEAIEQAHEAANDTEKASEEPTEGSDAETEAEGDKKAPKKAKAAKAPRAKKTVTTATGRCLCGCGTELGPKRRFAQGHDAKLHSVVLKVARGQAGRGALPEACVDKHSPTMTYLNGAPWMTDEIREAIGL